MTDPRRELLVVPRRVGDWKPHYLRDRHKGQILPGPVHHKMVEVRWSVDGSVSQAYIEDLVVVETPDDRHVDRALRSLERKRKVKRGVDPVTEEDILSPETDEELISRLTARCRDLTLSSNAFARCANEEPDGQTRMKHAQAMVRHMRHLMKQFPSWEREDASED